MINFTMIKHPLVFTNGDGKPPKKVKAYVEGVFNGEAFEYVLEAEVGELHRIRYVGDDKTLFTLTLSYQKQSMTKLRKFFSPLLGVPWIASVKLLKYTEAPMTIDKAYFL